MCELKQSAILVRPTKSKGRVGPHGVCLDRRVECGDGTVLERETEGEGGR
jgi:hypothetical protein